MDVPSHRPARRRSARRLVPVRGRDLDAGPAAPWITVANPLAVGTFGGGTTTNVASDEYFPYLDNSDNVFNALTDWYPPAQANDLWEIKLDALDAGSNPWRHARTPSRLRP